MTLYKSNARLVQNITKQVKNVLQAWETNGTPNKMLMKARIQAKFEKLSNRKDYSGKLLEKC